jgi:predicted ATP-dependent Lon-type protease
MVSNKVLLAFKHRFKNCTLPEIVPLANGYVYKNKLVIRKCPLCGRIHYHTVFDNKKSKGYLTIRVAHCHNEYYPEYIIKIVGSLTEREHERIIYNHNKKMESITKEEYEKLKNNEKIKKPITKMNNFDSLDYIKICDERESWI